MKLDSRTRGHDLQLLQTYQTSDGNGHVATEKCKRCGDVYRTSIAYRSSQPPELGSAGAVEPRDCPGETNAR